MSIAGAICLIVCTPWLNVLGTCSASYTLPADMGLPAVTGISLNEILAAWRRPHFRQAGSIVENRGQ
jgi:hypothetical protein